jgi:uncharacterized protein (DUF2147 family)
MKHHYVSWLSMAILFAGATALAENDADRILGEWLIGNGDVCVKVERIGSEYTGRITWLKEPVYPAGHQLQGQRKIDRFNPDESKRHRPLIGLTVLENLTYSGNNRWEGGTIYDADSGKTYRCCITLESQDELAVRGYVGLQLIGRTTKAFRATQNRSENPSIESPKDEPPIPETTATSNTEQSKIDTPNQKPGNLSSPKKQG